MYFNSSVNFAISAATSILPETGMKYSFDLALKVKAPSIASVMYSKLTTFPSFKITVSKCVVLFSWLITFKSMVSLNEMFLSFLMVLIPEITSVAKSKSVIICSL